MENTNPVSQILAPTGNQACLAAGARPDTLAIGQIGFFNVHTGLSIDGSVPVDAKDIFIAVGTDPLGTGSLSDINVSTGQMIQVVHSKHLTFKGYVAAAPKIIDITGFIARCQSDYQLKVVLRNGLGYTTNGYNQTNKTYDFRTGCCADTCGAPCALGDTNELVAGLVANISAETEKLLTAAAISTSMAATINAGASATGNALVTINKTVYSVPVVTADTAAAVAAKIVAYVNTASGSVYNLTAAGAVITTHGYSNGIFTIASNGTGVTANAQTAVTKTIVTDIPAYVIAQPRAALGIRITSANLANNVYGAINLNYVKGRFTDMDVFLTGGFECNGTVATLQELQRPEGLGYDLRQIEYLDGGWNGKPGPYRQSTTLGQERAGIIYNITLTGTYNQFVLGYDIKSASGFRDYMNPCEVIIAVPCADATTLSSIATFMDAIFTQFGAMANDIAANGDCTNVRTGLLTFSTDGLESLA